MSDSIYLEVGKSIQAQSGAWYKNLQVLGTGGNAVTFLVLATSGPNKGVMFALKVFRRLSALERRERFLSEIEFLSICKHPSIMPVYDSGVFRSWVAGEQLEYPFVVAEYLPETLASVMRSGGPTTPEKISYSLQLLSALRYLDAREPKVVHRDIKPQNIFVKGRSCVLGDFGLMKIIDGQDELDKEVLKESTGPGMPFFYRTPDLIAYAKSEAHLTPKSDVFQLGLAIAELFTGRNPANKSHDILAPLTLSDIGHVPGDLGARVSTLIKRMLIIDPEQRPDAEALIDFWQGVFAEAVERAHGLEGRVF